MPDRQLDEPLRGIQSAVGRLRNTLHDLRRVRRPVEEQSGGADHYPLAGPTETVSAVSAVSTPTVSTKAVSTETVSTETGTTKARSTPALPAETGSAEAGPAKTWSTPAGSTRESTTEHPCSPSVNGDQSSDAAANLYI
jgi:hypothetical protein